MTLSCQHGYTFADGTSLRTVMCILNSLTLKAEWQSSIPTCQGI